MGHYRILLSPTARALAIADLQQQIFEVLADAGYLIAATFLRQRSRNPRYLLHANYENSATSLRSGYKAPLCAYLRAMQSPVLA